MQTVETEVEYLDGEFTVVETIPATLSDVVELLGEEAVRSGAIDDTRYRNKYPRVYTKASAEIGALGFARDVKEEKTLKDGTIKKVLVSPMDHLRAFLAADDANRSILAEIFARLGKDEQLYVKGERTGGSGKVSQASLNAANQFFALGDEKVEQVVEIIESRIPGYKILRDSDGNATPESLARGISALEKHQQAEARRATAAALGM